MSTTTHCQICGRAIKTVVGYGPLGGGVKSDQDAGSTDRIAHHGYKRPHQQGYQTGSCFGARWRPYEVACDALPPAIEGLASYLARQQELLAAFTSSPPDVLKIERTDAYGKVLQTWNPTRPDPFDPEKPNYIQGSYVTEFRKRRQSFERNIKAATEDLAAFRARLAAWKAPQEQQVSA